MLTAIVTGPMAAGEARGAKQCTQIGSVLANRGAVRGSASIRAATSAHVEVGRREMDHRVPAGHGRADSGIARYSFSGLGMAPVCSAMIP